METRYSEDAGSGSSPAIMNGLKWLSVAMSVLVVVMALLAGQGVYEDRGLITGHGHLGNGIFALAAVQLVLAFLVYQKGFIGRNHLMLNALIILLLFGQIGLGYAGSRNNLSLVPWHMANGVFLMGASTINAVLFWIPSSSRNSKNR